LTTLLNPEIRYLNSGIKGAALCAFHIVKYRKQGILCFWQKIREVNRNEVKKKIAKQAWYLHGFLRILKPQKQNINFFIVLK